MAKNNNNLKPIEVNKNKPVEVVWEIKDYEVKKSPLSPAARGKVVNKSGSNYVSNNEEGYGPCTNTFCSCSNQELRQQLRQQEEELIEEKRHASKLDELAWENWEEKKKVEAENKGLQTKLSNYKKKFLSSLFRSGKKYKERVDLKTERVRLRVELINQEQQIEELRKWNDTFPDKTAEQVNQELKIKDQTIDDLNHKFSLLYSKSLGDWPHNSFYNFFAEKTSNEFNEEYIPLHVGQRGSEKVCIKNVIINGSERRNSIATITRETGAYQEKDFPEKNLKKVWIVND